MTSAGDSDRKCYAQACPIATALDVAGDRWTILLIRELLGGPARFQELLDGLSGIARNLLSNQLRRLQSDGIIHRVNAHGASQRKSFQRFCLDALSTRLASPTNLGIQPRGPAWFAL